MREETEAGKLTQDGGQSGLCNETLSQNKTKVKISMNFNLWSVKSPFERYNIHIYARLWYTVELMSRSIKSETV